MIPHLESSVADEPNVDRKEPVRHSGGRYKRRRTSIVFAQIEEKAAKGELLPGVTIEVLSLEKVAAEQTELLNICFRVPQEITRTTDPKTGLITLGSDGAEFTYTFSADRSLSENIVDLQEFYFTQQLRSSEAAVTG